MKKYEQFGIFDFSEYADELSNGDLIQVNGGSCGSGCGGGGGGPGGGGGGPSYTPSTSGGCNGTQKEGPDWLKDYFDKDFDYEESRQKMQNLHKSETKKFVEEHLYDPGYYEYFWTENAEKDKEYGAILKEIKSKIPNLNEVKAEVKDAYLQYIINNMFKNKYFYDFWGEDGLFMTDDGFEKFFGKNGLFKEEKYKNLINNVYKEFVKEIDSYETNQWKKLFGNVIDKQWFDKFGLDGKYLKALVLSQKIWEDLFTSDFSNSACAATSLLNELSSIYTMETGKEITVMDLYKAMAAAVGKDSVTWDSEKEKLVDCTAIDSEEAYVNNWEDAANAMAESLGLAGKFKYQTSADGADVVLIRVDTGKKNKDGIVEYDQIYDHFVNDIGGGRYFDPWDNTIGYIEDLHLGNKNTDGKDISPYVYLDYKLR